MTIPVLSDQDFGNSRKITNLPAATANGEPVVHEQRGELQSLAYATTLSASTRVEAWIADHPSGPGAYVWNGTAWIASSRSVNIVTATASLAVTAWGTIVQVDATSATGNITITLPQATSVAASNGLPIIVNRLDSRTDIKVGVAANGTDVLNRPSGSGTILREPYASCIIYCLSAGTSQIIANNGKQQDAVITQSVSGEWFINNSHVRANSTGGALTINAGTAALDERSRTVRVEHFAGSNSVTIAPLTTPTATTILNPFNYPLVSTTIGTLWSFFSVDTNTWLLTDYLGQQASGGVTNGDKGDITVTNSGTTWTIDDNVVTLAKLAQATTGTFLLRASAGTGNIEAGTATQATALLNVFTTLLKGLVPAPGTSTGRFLKDDGSWSPGPFAFGETIRRFSISPGGAALYTSTGIALASTGTLSNPQQNSSSLLNRTPRIQISTTATAGNTAHVRGNVNRVWRGTSAGQGGFKINIPFSLSALQVSQRGFIGISSSTGNATNVDPTTSTTDGKLGVGFITNTGNWQLIIGNNAAAPTFADLGANFPIDITTWFEIIISCAANDSVYTYEVINKTTGFTTGQLQVGVNIPANNFYMGPYMWITNNLTAGVASFSFGHIVCEYNI